jgi:hypothetical protein
MLGEIAADLNIRAHDVLPTAALRTLSDRLWGNSHFNRCDLSFS